MDVSVNSQISTPRVNALFRLLHLYLRNVSAQNIIGAYVADSSNNKSILTLSAVSSRKGPSRTKRTPGSEVYPFVMMLRQLLRERAGTICGSDVFDLVSQSCAGYGSILMSRKRLAMPRSS